MVKIIHAKKILTDAETNKLEGTKLKKGYFKTVFKTDVDVFDENGEYILRFRKNVLPSKNIDKAYDNLISHARKITKTRGVAGGNVEGKMKTVSYNVPIASNILGYFDTLSLKQKAYFRDAGMFKQKPICRQTAFNMDYPLKWKEIVPLIQDINNQYKKLFPKEYAEQYKAAQSTKFVIDKTAFSTITTNLNLQTSCHHDKGDYNKGFGNLVVIEKGKYSGGYTGFPQYGVAVDVRSGDFLGMNVHLLHGNEPIHKITADAERLSLVSYLRQGIVDKCKGMPVLEKSFFEKARKKAEQNRKMGKTKKMREDMEKILERRKQQIKKNKKTRKLKNT